MDLATELFSQASNLPPEEREALAFRILKSLPDWGDPESPLMFSDEDEAEPLKRSERHRANPSSAVTAADGLAELQSLVEGFAAATTMDAEATLRRAREAVSQVRNS